MFDIESWQEVWVTITRNKRRSLLTAFGVFWGIFMLIIMLGAGKGLGDGIYSNAKGVSENSTIMFTNMTTEPYHGFRKGRYWNFREGDMALLEAKVPDIKVIVPFVMGGSQPISHGDKSGTYRVKGHPPVYDLLLPQIMLYGRYINQVDIQEQRKVCVIGERLYEELFLNGENPLGQYIKMYNVNFKIVGVAKPSVAGVNINGSDEEALVIPYTVLQKFFNMGDVIHAMGFITQTGVPVVQVEEQIKAVLKARHHISPSDNAALQSINLEKIYNQFKMLFYGINLLVWIVGIGTLIAGVVGVSNIIMVTVRERTKEIGVRRALGARPSAIMMQIIKESTALTLMAGFLGLAFGVFILDLVNKVVVQNMTGDVFFSDPQITFSSAISAAVILLVCGVLAGILPAYRALEIKAIDAIREED